MSTPSITTYLSAAQAEYNAQVAENAALRAHNTELEARVAFLEAECATLKAQLATTVRPIQDRVTPKGSIEPIGDELYWREGRKMYSYDMMDGKGAFLGILAADGETITPCDKEPEDDEDVTVSAPAVGGAGTRAAAARQPLMTWNDMAVFYASTPVLNKPVTELDDRFTKRKNLQAFYRYLRGLELPKECGGKGTTFGTPGADRMEDIHVQLPKLFAARKATGWNGIAPGRFTILKE